MAATPTARPADDESVTPEPVVPAKVRTDAEQARISRIDEMKVYFKNQKRVRVKVRNDADVPVQINGYTFIVQAGVPVDVPEDVAALLEAADYI
jgi:hypothetical protein